MKLSQPRLGRCIPLAVACCHTLASAQNAMPEALPAPATLAVEGGAIPIAGWSYTVRSAATVGMGVRTKGQKSTLKPGGSNNSDDGNLNYHSGDSFSRVVKVTSKANIKHSGGYGVEVGATAWYDDNLQRHGVAHGNNPNNFVPGAPLSDSGFDSAARFQGVELLDAHLYGTTELLGGPLAWRIGRLSVERDQGFSFNGGMRDVETRNTAASTRPGALPDEGVVPVWATTARWNLSPAWRLDGFVQFANAHGVAPGCGTYMASNDYTADGCNRVFYSSRFTEQQNVARGIFTSRGDDVEPTNRPDQFGVSASYLLKDLGTRVGLHYAHYHSRGSYTSVQKGRVLGPSGGSTYVVEYPGDKNLLSLTTATRNPQASITWLNEVSITNGQPVQLNNSDLQTAFLTGGSLLGADAIAARPGSLYHGYDRFRVVQAQTGALKDFAGFWDASKSFLGAEVALKHVAGLPDVNQRRYGRPESSEVCANAAACATNDGYVTSNAWAYRIRAGMEFANVGGTQVRLRPSVNFAHDVKGWSYDYAFIQGRKSVRLALDADFGKDVFANVAYAASRGGQFNTRKDRDFVVASVGIKF